MMDLLQTSYQRNLGISPDFDLARGSGDTEHHGYRPGYYGTQPYGSNLANLYRTDYQIMNQSYNEGMYIYLFSSK